MGSRGRACEVSSQSENLAGGGSDQVNLPPYIDLRAILGLPPGNIKCHEESYSRFSEKYSTELGVLGLIGKIMNYRT